MTTKPLANTRRNAILQPRSPGGDLRIYVRRVHFMWRRLRPRGRRGDPSGLSRAGKAFRPPRNSTRPADASGNAHGLGTSYSPDSDYPARGWAHGDARRGPRILPRSEP